MITEEQFRANTEEVYDASWEFHYKGVECEFELSSDEDAIVHHLEVPKSMRNEGIGTKLINYCENLIKEETSAKTIYVQIGAPTGATEHILKNKLGYEIVGIEKRETLGPVIDAYKTINS